MTEVGELDILHQVQRTARRGNQRGSNGVNVDIESHRNPVGFDIHRASNQRDLSSLEATALPLHFYKIG